MNTNPYTPDEYTAAMMYAVEAGCAQTHFICVNLNHFLELTSVGSIKVGEDDIFRKVSSGKPVMVFNPRTGRGEIP